MKKFFILFLFLLGFAFIGQLNVNADSVTTYEEAVEIVERANNQIDAEIANAIKKEALLENHPHYEEKLDDVIELLLVKTSHISEKTIEELEKEGFVVECEYITVIIGDRIVQVDPLRVHRW